MVRTVSVGYDICQPVCRAARSCHAEAPKFGPPERLGRLGGPNALLAALAMAAYSRSLLARRAFAARCLAARLSDRRRTWVTQIDAAGSRLRPRDLRPLSPKVVLSKSLRGQPIR